MDTLRTDIVIILDRSGSMRSCADDVVGGFNTFIDEQKKAKGKAFITLAQFDDKYDIVYEDRPVEEISNLDFSPRGTTALLDAIGKTVVSTKEKVKSKRPGPDSVVILIITDGYENSSKEWKKEQIASLTKECENKLGWKFVYIGANQDAFGEAEGLGIKTSGVRNYKSNSKGTREMWDSLSRSTTNYRSKAFKLKSNNGDIRSLNKLNYFDGEDSDK